MPFSKAEAITRKIRACCDHLALLDDAVRHDVGVTASMRGILEALHERGAQTVPQIARAKRVTRQHIQALTDRLLDGKLVSAQVNPKDRRSPLLGLTEHGEAVFERMREREVGIFTEMTRALGDCDIDVALETLDTLRAYLDKKSAEAAHHP